MEIRSTLLFLLLGKLLNTILVGEDPYDCVLLLDKNLLLTSKRGRKQISVIDLTTNQVVTTIKELHAMCQSIEISQGENQAYILNNYVSVIVVDYQKDNILDKLKP